MCRGTLSSLFVSIAVKFSSEMHSSRLNVWLLNRQNMLNGINCFRWLYRSWVLANIKFELIIISYWKTFVRKCDGWCPIYLNKVLVASCIFLMSRNVYQLKNKYRQKLDRRFTFRLSDAFIALRIIALTWTLIYKLSDRVFLIFLLREWNEP